MGNEILYHYTSLENMSKIIQSKKLWLSSVFYQNDREELIFGLKQIIDIISTISLKNKLEENELKYIEMISKELPDSPLGIYSFSLTPKGNLLSQWRGYTNLNEGVSIGFDKSNLIKRAALNDCELIDCVYGREKSHQHLYDCVMNLLRSDELQKLEYDDKAFFVSSELVKVAIALKNEAFHEEKEVRLIYYDKGFPSKKKERYRVTSKYIVPYAELDISNLNDDGTIFSHVYNGPHEYQDISFKSLSDYLSNENACYSTTSSIIQLR